MRAVKKAGSGDPLSFLVALLSQQTGDVIATARAKGKSNGLDDGHQGESYTHGAGGAGADLSHKKGIGHVVNGGDHHADDGGDCQAHDELRNGGFRHTAELFLGCFKGFQTAIAFLSYGFNMLLL